MHRFTLGPGRQGPAIFKMDGCAFLSTCMHRTAWCFDLLPHPWVKMPKHLKSFDLLCAKWKTWGTKFDLQFTLSSLPSLVTTPTFFLETEDCHLHWEPVSLLGVTPGEGSWSERGLTSAAWEQSFEQWTGKCTWTWPLSPEEVSCSLNEATLLKGGPRSSFSFSEPPSGVLYQGPGSN